jgi:hypothetical protein
MWPSVVKNLDADKTSCRECRVMRMHTGVMGWLKIPCTRETKLWVLL